MKRNIIRTLIAILITSAAIQACDPLEPSSYTETFYRIASVKYADGKASLKFDYTNENFNLDNFKVKSDLDRFELQDGDRIIAELQLNAIGNMANNKLTLQRAIKYPIMKISDSRPSDTLNNDYRFNVLNLAGQQYPAIWAQGHLVNLAPIYYVPSDESKAEFHLYPLEVHDDTLVMRLYSDIPDNDLAIRGYGGASQTWLCFDIASMRDTIADTTEFKHRKSLLRKIQNLNQDTFMVHIFQPDTLRGMLDTIYYERYPRVSVSIPVPFDF